MPSIPQSLLWISLVVLWLFVLVPMLVSKRDTVRRTSDVALATRVLDTGRIRVRRRGPAHGHHSDPHWEPVRDDFEMAREFEFEPGFDAGSDAGSDRDPVTTPRRAVVLAASAPASTEPDYLDVDVVEEDSGALPVGAGVREPQLPLDFGGSAQPNVPVPPNPAVTDTAAFTLGDLREVDHDEAHTDAFPSRRAAGAEDAAGAARALRTDRDGTGSSASPQADPDAGSASGRPSGPSFTAGQPDPADADPNHDYDHVDDSSGMEAIVDDDALDAMSPMRNRYESKTGAAVSARKFRFRKRMLTVLATILLISAIAAFTLTPSMWWACATVGVATVLYLGYLRRQTRIEEQLRRRRAQRVARSRLGVENTNDRDYDVVPARLRRPGSAVLEIDDEDPVFEHLDETRFARDYDLPRASGQ